MSSITSSTVHQTNVQTNGSKVTMKSTLGVDMIEGMKTALALKTKSYDDKIEKIDDRTNAFAELTTLLTNLSKASDKLKQNELVTDQENSFLKYVTTGGSSSNIVSNITGPTTEKTFTIEVIQTASYDVRLSNTAATDSTTALNLDAQITLVALDTPTVNDVIINIGTTDTIDSIITKINRQTDIHGTIATKVPVNGGGYKLEFSSSNVAQPLNYSISVNSGDSDLLPALGSPSTVDSLSSNVKYNGNSLGYLPTNNIEVGGVTMSIENATLNTPTTISVIRDLVSVESDIKDFVSAYNAAIDFVENQRKIVQDDNGNDVRGPIVDSLALQELDFTLRSIFNGVFNNLATGASNEDLKLTTVNNVTGIAYLGIVVGEDAKLSIDDSDLNDALLNKTEKLRKVFQFNAELTSGDPEIVFLTRPSEQFYGNVVAQMTKSGSTYTGKITYNSVDYNASVTTTGNVVTFKINDTTSPLYGAEFYVDTTGLADGTKTANFKLTHGVSNTISKLVTDTNSQITTETSKLKDEKDAAEEKIEKIKANNKSIIERYEAKISRMEAALEKLHSMNTMLDMMFKSKEK